MIPGNRVGKGPVGGAAAPLLGLFLWVLVSTLLALLVLLEASCAPLLLSAYSFIGFNAIGENSWEKRFSPRLLPHFEISVSPR